MNPYSSTSADQGVNVVAQARPVAVIGAGFVGLVTTAVLAHLGRRVRCLDIDEGRIARLQMGDVPLHEPGLAKMLREEADRITYTTSPTDVGGCELAFVCVDTPPMRSGDADLSRVERAVSALPVGNAPLTLVMKSTVPVGTGARIVQMLRRRGLRGVGYVSNPEFLREGSAVADALAPHRVVIGSDGDDASDRVAALWRPLGGVEVRCDIASAEMIKLASNGFLATKISFINEIANVCDAVGADVEVVARGMGLDPRIGLSFLHAGIGFGGSCFPKDVVALKQLAGNSGYHFQLLASVLEVNELQKRRVISILEDRLGSLDGLRIALLGLAFKRDTDDTRESASLVLAERLVSKGARVVAFDPVVSESPGLGRVSIKIAETLGEALDGADAAVIATDWPEFVQLSDASMARRMARPLVVDGRNLLDPVVAAEAGIEWVGIGRPSMIPVTNSSVVARGR